MRSAAIALVRPLEAPLAWSAACFVASVGLFAAAMGPRLIAQLQFGPICSGHAVGAMHCPACYAALALLGAAITMAVRGVASRR